MKTLYITGYWPLVANPKNNLQYYSHQRLATQKLLKDKDVFEYDVTTHRMSSLPGWHASEEYANHVKAAATSCAQQKRDLGPDINYYEWFEGDKTPIHLYRDYMDSDYDTYRKMLAIWFSKVYLVSQMVDRYRYRYDQFAWVDASFARFNRNLEFDYDKDVIIHYPSKMRQGIHHLKLNASFMQGTAEAWDKVVDLYHYALITLAKDEYHAHDEETVLHNVITHFSQYFDEVTNATPKILR